MSSARRVSATVTLVVVVLALVVGVSSHPADAASYRYWTFWTGGSGGWDFATRGADRVPADGTVDGWRFAVSDAAGTSARPGVSSSFDQICGSTSAVAGKKRVGLVIDFGSNRDAPEGESPPAGTVARCLVLPTSANSYQVLAKVTALRVEQGLICGISGYPRTGCGDDVKDPPAEPTEEGGADKGDGGGGKETPSTGVTNGSTPSAQPTSSQGAVGGTGAASKPTAVRSGGSKTPATKPAESTEPSGEVAAALETDLPPTSPDRGSPIGLLVGVALILCLATVGVVTARRRR